METEVLVFFDGEGRMGSRARVIVTKRLVKNHWILVRKEVLKMQLFVNGKCLRHSYCWLWTVHICSTRRLTTACCIEISLNEGRLCGLLFVTPVFAVVWPAW